MIVRIWRSDATVCGAAMYRHHFERNVLPALKCTPGFLKAYLLTREMDGVVDIEVHTLWQSPDAIQAFTKGDPNAAVVEPEAQSVLKSFDRSVSHYEATEYPV